MMRPLLLILALLLGAAPGLHAQGGPPMVTDDPGTPGNGHWEINLAWTVQQAPGSTIVGLPLLDANYGVGDRLQLNYQASWNFTREAGEANENGMSGSQLAVKWRFYDAGEDGLQVSMYPRYTFPESDSDSDPSNPAGSTATFLMPFEVRKNLGIVSVNADFGYTFSAAEDAKGWMGGLCIGRNVTKSWELDAEIRYTGSERLQRSETAVNIGTRYDFNEHSTLLLAIGRDMSSALGPRISLLSYVGIQLRI
jgi:hypothetical protein